MDNVNLTLSSILNDKSGLTLNDAFIKVEEDKHTVEEKLHNLIYTNYKVFLTSSQSSKDINEEFVIIKELSHNLSVSLPNYKEICNQFINVAKEINTRHKKAKLALIKYPKLIDFLEIPQLMDTCFKNGLYEETLHLHEFVKKMMQNLPHIQILNLVYNDSLSTYQSLIRGLSANLTSDSPTLAQAIERVGLLRVAGVFNEKAIRLLFLSRASRALRNDLKKLTRDHSEPLNYLFANRVCETLRIHLFETITQYSALFSLEEDSNSRSFTPTSFSQSDDTRAMSRKETYNRIFNSWLAFELQNALTLIDYQTGLLFDKNRNLISESELGLAFRSLADQFDYFSMTMSKLNADCGHLLMQKLCEYATSYVSRMFDDVLRKFISNLQQKSHYFCKLVPKEISTRKTTLMPVLESQVKTSTSPKSHDSNIAEPIVTDQIVSDFSNQNISNGDFEEISEGTSRNGNTFEDNNESIPEKLEETASADVLPTAKPSVTDNHEKSGAYSVSSNVDMMNSIPLLNNLSKELGRVLESSSLLRSDSNTSFAFTYPLCKDKLLETMVKCWEQIDQFYRENTKTSYSGRTTSDDLVTLSQMREAFVEYLVPHVIRAFNSIYPKHELEQILGISALKPFHMFPDTESMCQSIKDQVVKIR